MAARNNNPPGRPSQASLRNDELRSQQSGSSRSITKADAPRSRPCGAKSCPSTVWPGRQRNKLPGFALRESVSRRIDHRAGIPRLPERRSFGSTTIVRHNSFSAYLQLHNPIGLSANLTTHRQILPSLSSNDSQSFKEKIRHYSTRIHTVNGR